MPTTFAAALVILIGLQSALFLDPEVPLAPASWAIISICIWLLVVLSKGGWSELTVNDKRRFLFGIFASIEFIHFLQYDAEFKGWQSVYYFCGHELQYCTCNFRWNVWGWIKAVVLWNFVLTATLGAQALIIQAGLGGLLPGEEAVTRESVISICWRLIPFWLNNWEQQWGAEVSSMTFELPHFAVELLIILPCCQIICSRLKLLVTPLWIRQGPRGVDEGPLVLEDFAPNVLEGFWERRPEQRNFLPRVRSNLRVLVFLTGLTAMAALNATLVPLYLEGQAAGAPGTPAIMLIGRHSTLLSKKVGKLVPLAQTKVAAAELPLLLEARERYRMYGEMNCSDSEPYVRSVAKHAVELQRIRDPEHRALIPLVEAALAIMRLSCEKYFVLVAIYVAFLLFRDPPRPARAVIRLVARVSGVFQKVILFAFPVVCWLYNAGFIFSLFVSVVFWGGPLLMLYDTARSALREVCIRSLSPATAEQVDHMNGNCIICWCDMAPNAVQAPPARATASDVTTAATGAAGNSTLSAATGSRGSTSSDYRSVGSDDGIGSRQSAGSAEVGVGEVDESGENMPGQAVAGATAAAAMSDDEIPFSVGESATQADPRAMGWALPCGHAYHYDCLMQWMEQCSSTGVKQVCPMCQRSIQLQVRWRLPRSLRCIVGAAAVGTARPLDDAGDAALPGAGRRRARVRHWPREAPPEGDGDDEDALGGGVDAAGGEDRNVAAHVMQLLELLEHQRELQELLHEHPHPEIGEILQDAQPLVMQREAQLHANEA
ncbi:hypothetical protein Vretimale_8764 [Volvox reticuliferus]|uniref:RING-type domain-containing protein n=1 Tax=Volvox reticuliferus TaxID=1737510 RepID=A0A8J4LNP6_9CHLO|nr:hypothetical protein Vretifemale_6210 [Volvox reticuliferus]GIM04215.1 hypothetical protein Vretimale_8764 [Volvox reticuliferus]